MNLVFDKSFDVSAYEEISKIIENEYNKLKANCTTYTELNNAIEHYRNQYIYKIAGEFPTYIYNEMMRIFQKEIDDCLMNKSIV